MSTMGESHSPGLSDSWEYCKKGIHNPISEDDDSDTRSDVSSDFSDYVNLEQEQVITDEIPPIKTPGVYGSHSYCYGTPLIQPAFLSYFGSWDWNYLKTFSADKQKDCEEELVSISPTSDSLSIDITPAVSIAESESLPSSGTSTSFSTWSTLSDRPESDSPIQPDNIPPENPNPNPQKQPDRQEQKTPASHTFIFTSEHAKRLTEHVCSERNLELLNRMLQKNKTEKEMKKRKNNEMREVEDESNSRSYSLRKRSK